MGLFVQRLSGVNGVVALGQTKQAGAVNHQIAKTFTPAKFNPNHPKVAYDGEIKGDLANRLDLLS